jgi:Domain of unknown function (DUF3291)
MLASVTRLRVRSFLNLPAFLWRTFLVRRQTTHAPGFIGGRLLIDNLHTYWTLTVWEDEKSMKAFRGSGMHGGVMLKLAEWCDEAAYAHWIADRLIPSWPEAYERLVSEGRLSRVARPSQDHKSQCFRKPRLQPLIGVNLKPAQVRRKRGL